MAITNFICSFHNSKHIGATVHLWCSRQSISYLDRFKRDDVNSAGSRPVLKGLKESCECDSVSCSKVTPRVRCSSLSACGGVGSGLSGGLQHVGQTDLIIRLQNVPDRRDGEAVYWSRGDIWSRDTRLKTEPDVWDPFNASSSSLASQMNLTSTSLIKFPHWSPAPLPSSV